MKKQIVFAFILFILLTTIIPSEKITISKFGFKKVITENNFIVKDEEINDLLAPFYDKNLIFLKKTEIETALMQNSYIESFIVKKKYPDTLKVKIFEKKPFAVLINKKEKFLLSDKIQLIKFNKNENHQDLPLVLGNQEKFLIFYNDLKKINFPFKIIKRYIFYETNRWDIETINNKIVKLSPKDYIENLRNYLSLRDKTNFKKYKVFDYRLKNQLILK
tara:strand:+ start:1596 stop:2252 length:657 start_codon:yes stop_codon:yes gene_type:complete